MEKVDRTLPLNQMIFYVHRDAELRRRWREDFDARAHEFALSTAEIEAVKTADVRRLNDMGVHQYYVSQILRLSFGPAGDLEGHVDHMNLREPFVSARRAGGRAPSSMGEPFRGPSAG